MSDYKEKYLKYKNKYLELKSKIDVQNGGNYFMAGTYVFFLNENYRDKLKLENKSVLDLIDFDETTNKWGNCALYLRIGESGWNDFTNSYNTIYPNRGVLEIAGATTKGVIDGTSQTIYQSADAIKSLMTKQTGGVDCKYLPTKIMDVLGVKDISSIDGLIRNNDVIGKLVEGINKTIIKKERDDDGKLPITSVLIIKKESSLSFQAKLLYYFNIEYPSGKVIEQEIIDTNELIKKEEEKREEREKLIDIRKESRGKLSSLIHP